MPHGDPHIRSVSGVGLGTEDLANARRKPCLREDLYSGLADAAKVPIWRRTAMELQGCEAVHAPHEGRCGGAAIGGGQALSVRGPFAHGRG